jgi:hypothetical protein
LIGSDGDHHHLSQDDVKERVLRSLRRFREESPLYAEG